MTIRSRHWAVLAVIALVTIVGGCRWEPPYTNPPEDFKDADLAGTWEAHYANFKDTLIIKEDGTFKQVFTAPNLDYTFETLWNPWRTERFADGRVRFHLQGARNYYGSAIKEAELDGLKGTFPTQAPGGVKFPTNSPKRFWDPLMEDFVRMVGELVLNVQMTRSGKPVLLHMLNSSDEAFIVLLEGGAVGFRRVKGP